MPREPVVQNDAKEQRNSGSCLKTDGWLVEHVSIAFRITGTGVCYEMKR